MKKLISIFFLVLLIQSCTTATLGPPLEFDTNKILIVDNRTDEEKQPYRENIFSAIRFLGDQSMGTNIKDYFISKLATQESSLKEIYINNFIVADFFPSRMRTAMADWIFMPNTNTKFVSKEELPNNTDMIIAYYKGTINGKQIEARSIVPYKISPMAGLVEADPGFVAAADKAFDIAINSIKQQLNQ